MGNLGIKGEQFCQNFYIRRFPKAEIWEIVGVIFGGGGGLMGWFGCD